jgi:predicted nucleic acid-binding protein
MAPLYLETNFLMSFAYGQHSDTEPLLQQIEAKQVEIIMPEVCLVEALAAWRNKRSRLLAITSGYSEHQRELSRWQSVVDAPDASDMFRDLPVKLELANTTVLDRLLDCFKRLEPRTTFISGDRAWLDPAMRVSRINGYADDYICSAIIHDARTRSAASYFLTENKDVHEPTVVADLASVAVAVLKTPTEAMTKYP